MNFVNSNGHLLGGFIYSVIIQFATMKLDFRTSDFFYNLSYNILRFSGFLFFSMERLGSAIRFHQSWMDYAWFAISFSFSLTSLIGGISFRKKLQLQSTIMDIAPSILWKASMISILSTKIINFTRARSLYEIIMNLKWFDQEVGYTK